MRWWRSRLNDVLCKQTDDTVDKVEVAGTQCEQWVWLRKLARQTKRKRHKVPARLQENAATSVDVGLLARHWDWHVPINVVAVVSFSLQVTERKQVLSSAIPDSSIYLQVHDGDVFPRTNECSSMAFVVATIQSMLLLFMLKCSADVCNRCIM